MNLVNGKYLFNPLGANVANRTIDARLSLSLKREFWVSKANGFFPAKDNRRFHAYCIGTPRSGTHSIAHMLQPYYSALHEPHGYYAIYHLLKWATGQYTYSDIQNVLQWRDKKMSLELEAAHYLHHVTDVLVASFPKAKFIFTVRDPLSWLESEINRNYGTRYKPFWRELEDYRYSRHGKSFTHYDRALEKLGLYPITSYFSYWKRHNQFVLDSVPKQQLLTLETKQIRSHAKEISDFLNIAPDTINTKKSHSDKMPKKLKLSELVDKAYLYHQLEAICSDLLDSQFPGLKQDWHTTLYE